MFTLTFTSLIWWFCLGFLVGIIESLFFPLYPMWGICLWWARLWYFFKVIPNGNWGPEYYAIPWYRRFNKKKADELAEEYYPGIMEWHYEDGDD